MLQRRLKPPPHIQQHPRLISVRADRLEDQLPRDAVEEGGHIKVDDPVRLPAVLAALVHRVDRGPPRPVRATRKVVSAAQRHSE